MLGAKQADTIHYKHHNTLQLITNMMITNKTISTVP